MIVVEECLCGGSSVRREEPEMPLISTKAQGRVEGYDWVQTDLGLSQENAT